MRRRKWILFPLIAAILFLTACGSSRIRMGTAGIGGVYYTFGNAFAEVIHKASGPGVEVKETTGSAANLRLLSEDFLRLAIAQNDLLTEALLGTGGYEGKALSGFSAVAGLYTEVCQVVVRSEANISDISELYGHTVSIGEKESGTERSAKDILAAYGLNAGMVSMTNLTYAQAVAAMEAGEIDAFFCTAGVSTNVISELAQKISIRILPVAGRAAENLLRSGTCYSKAAVPAGTYAGQEEEIQTLGVRSVLLASDKLDEQTVKTLTSLLFANADELEKAIPVEFDLTPETAVNDIRVPFHKGAAAYYQEAGVTLPGEEE